MTTHPPDVHDLVRLPLGKGCVLVLTWAEYRRGIARGKALRRRETLEQRLTRHEQRGDQ